LGRRLATGFSGCGGNKLGLGCYGARGVRVHRLGASGVCAPMSLSGLGRAARQRVVMEIIPRWLDALRDCGPPARGHGSHPAVVGRAGDRSGGRSGLVDGVAVWFR
jgi:hypothetical protein